MFILFFLATQDLQEGDEDECFLDLDGNRPRKGVNLLTIIQVKEKRKTNCIIWLTNDIYFDIVGEKFRTK